MKFCTRARGYTVIETMFTALLIGVVGLIIYSLLNAGMVLGAKNTAVNTAHQQARVGMLDMLQDIHSAVSTPTLINIDPKTGQAAGVSFQQWAGGPYRINNDATTSQNYVQITLPLTTTPPPLVGQQLIIPSHQIEADISAVSPTSGATNYRVTLINFRNSPLPNINNLPAKLDVKGSSSLGDIVCFLTDRCSYSVTNNVLTWNWRGVNRTISTDITNSQGLVDPAAPPTPFSFPVTPAGAPYSRFVAAIDLSTSDQHYSKRGYKSANILLNGQVPYKARLTTYQ